MVIASGGRTTHTTLECRNVVDSLRFYREVMGLWTNQIAPGVGHVVDSRGHYTAILQKANPAPQPFLNFYARPVATAAEVDAAHAAMLAVRDSHQIGEVTAPAVEDASRFGVASYGFYVKDRDGNWWRVEDNRGPFGPVELPASGGGLVQLPARDGGPVQLAANAGGPIAGGDAPSGSIVPRGPISYVMLESKRLAVSVGFYRDVLGLAVEQPMPHYAKLTDAGGSTRVIVVEVGDRLVPQNVANHHGITFAGEPAVIDALHAQIGARAGEFAVRKVFSATHQHGSYSFYLQDADTNCWELEIWHDGISPVERAIRGLEL